MDLNVTGKFIQERRKEKGLTQAQLAEKLIVSEKTISKWETGKGFPDTSLILPLCKELEINANELLSGEKISDENYKQKAEENIIETLKKASGENTLYKKMANSLMYSGVFLLIFGMLLLGTWFCFFTKLEVFGVIDKVLLICLIIFGLGTSVSFGFFIASGVMKESRDIVKYECEKCHNDFYHERPNYILKKNREKSRKLKCPYCKEKTNCKHKKG